MRKIRFFSIVSGIAILLSISLLSSCSDLKQNLPTPVTAQLQVHEKGWNDTTSAAFHGKVLKQVQYEFDECVTCHSKLYTGGTSGVSCFKCHQSFPHSSNWTDTTNAMYHGNYLKLKDWQESECSSCHGAGFAGGSSGVACFTCHRSYPHLSGWENPAASSSHGKYLKTKSWQLTECTSCHGTSFAGGTSGQSCYSCHSLYPHPAGFAGVTGHPSYLKTQGFPLVECQTCHGSSYTGGPVVNVSCSSSGCHVDRNNAPKSPEACNTCHGDFSGSASDTASFAPPRTVAGETASTVRGVGAHQVHLSTGILGKSVNCQECHVVPTQVSSAGHLGTNLPAEVVFNNALAGLATAGGTYIPNPSYDPLTLKCSNTYCHGNWKVRKATSPLPYFFSDSVMTGSNRSPAWTGGAFQAMCGTCHGLPPTGHFAAAISECANCHGDVVNSAGAIIDKTKHINGKINVFGQEVAF